MSVNCTSHNLCELEELTTELRKCGFALNTLMDHDFKFDQILPFTDYIPEDFDLWYGLLCDRISATQQVIHDLCVWEKALRKGSDFNPADKGDEDDG